MSPSSLEIVGSRPMTVPSLGSPRPLSLCEVLAFHESFFVGLQGAPVPLCHPPGGFTPCVMTSRLLSADSRDSSPVPCPGISGCAVGGRFSLG